MTAYNRPEYTHKVLTALSKCYHAEKYSLIAFIEPGNNEVREIFRKAYRFPVKAIIGHRKRGCNMNTHAALNHASKLCEFWIHLEDDTVPSPDFLDYMRWAENEYYMDEKVFSVSGYSQRNPSFDECYAAQRRCTFTPWGFGIWRKSWRRVSTFIERGGNSWDALIGDFVTRQGFVEIWPVWSRIQNIGAIGGVHVQSPEWHAKNQHVKYVADCAPGYYHEKTG